MGQYLTALRASIADASVYEEIQRTLDNWSELFAAGAYDARAALSELLQEFGLTMLCPGYDESIFTETTWLAAIDAPSRAIRQILLWKHIWLYVTCVTLLARCGRA